MSWAGLGSGAASARAFKTTLFFPKDRRLSCRHQPTFATFSAPPSFAAAESVYFAGDCIAYLRSRPAGRHATLSWRSGLGRVSGGFPGPPRPRRWFAVKLSRAVFPPATVRAMAGVRQHGRPVGPGIRQPGDVAGPKPAPPGAKPPGAIASPGAFGTLSAWAHPQE